MLYSYGSIISFGRTMPCSADTMYQGRPEA